MFPVLLIGGFFISFVVGITFYFVNKSYFKPYITNTKLHIPVDAADYLDALVDLDSIDDVPVKRSLEDYQEKMGRHLKAKDITGEHGKVKIDRTVMNRRGKVSFISHDNSLSLGNRKRPLSETNWTPLGLAGLLFVVLIAGGVWFVKGRHPVDSRKQTGKLKSSI